MRVTELLEIHETLKEKNLPVPFGFILEPESFTELREDIRAWAQDYELWSPKNFADFKSTHEAPFRFMSFWFDRSDAPNR